MVQLYRSESLGTEPRALRTLRGFEKVRLDPGASATVALRVPDGATAGELWLGPSSDEHDLTRLAEG